MILLDTRSFKEPAIKDPRSKAQKQAAGLSGSMGNYLPNRDPNVTLLGSEQWQWLKKQLEQPSEIRLIVSGTQIIPDQKAMDEWGNYPLERQRLFDLIKTTKASGVLLISGNVHFNELSRQKGAGYPLIEFTSSGLTHNNPAYAAQENPYRIAGPYDQDNFGMVEIDWQSKPSPLISLKAITLAGQVAFEHRIALKELNSY